MSAISLMSKDKRLRFYTSEFFLIRLKLAYYLNSSTITKIDRYYLTFFFFKKLKWKLFSGIQAKDRCLVTGRSRAVFTYFRLNRMTLKNFSSYGIINGVFKTSW
jgi:ribosomal protein S14